MREAREKERERKRKRERNRERDGVEKDSVRVQNERRGGAKEFSCFVVKMGGYIE